MKGRTDQKELFNRVLASSQFATSDSLRRILAYLFSHSHEPESTQIKEYTIAVEALDRPTTFDPKVDPIIRVNMAAIRRRLNAYFDGPGHDEPVQLQIPKGQYRLCFVERAPKNGEAAARQPARKHTRRFWAQYLAPNRPNILMYSELLFFRDHRGNYVRSIYVNDPAIGAAQIREYFPQAMGADLEPSFHFASSGEIWAILAIQGALSEMGAPVKVTRSRFLSWPDIQKSNLIVLGGSRTNTFLNSLQGRACFVVLPDRIENLNVRPGEQDQYKGHHFMDGRLERRVEYVVVTRRPGVAEGRSVTLVAANHGRAIEGAGISLVSEDTLGSILVSMGQTDNSELPAHFQILLRVDMIDFDEEVVNVEYVTHRVLD